MLLNSFRFPARKIGKKSRYFPQMDGKGCQKNQALRVFTHHPLEAAWYEYHGVNLQTFTKAPLLEEQFWSSYLEVQDTGCNWLYVGL